MADEESSKLKFLQEIVSKFPKGISLAFAYGSGVFKQEGNISAENMIDFVFVVDDSYRWHEENIALHSSHYSFLKNFGTNAIVTTQDSFGAGVYYNTLVPFYDRMIKYGVISLENFQRDMHSWEWLYTSGRLHKPVQIIHRAQGSAVRTALNANLASAVNAALLCLPEEFDEEELYMTISWFSYAGDFRMIVGEDKGKVKKIVNSNLQGFQDLYRPLLSKRSDLNLSTPRRTIQQDLSNEHTFSLLQALPDALLRRVVRYSTIEGKNVNGNSLNNIAQDRSKCAKYLRQGVVSIVMTSSITQSMKGIVTAGLVKTLAYSSQKLKKMFRGMVR
ncbi:phosphatidate cytidylyltransferase, mitochondrial-like [Actinia tenebrosa]|uniref:Phosphatidate cytidylyltransferase, mitochondrial n=1 Tax=Actinia tenebrosa TaxID=6105 RepID=A0A6P8IPK6_ACTTE|nr:phosphatidate cytidylyltransferase, mitochondrial-like [Actinia tenebrosa]